MLRSMVPWAEKIPTTFSRLENEMTNLFDRHLLGVGEWAPSRFAPPLDVSETDNAYVVSVELPGMSPEDVQVEMKDGDLWISGEKHENKEEQDETFHRVERRHGEFCRMIRLTGNVDEGKVEAKFTNGILTVEVPKSDKSKSKRISVKSS